MDSNDELPSVYEDSVQLNNEVPEDEIVGNETRLSTVCQFFNEINLVLDLWSVSTVLNLSRLYFAFLSDFKIQDYFY